MKTETQIRIELNRLRSKQKKIHLEIIKKLKDDSMTLDNMSEHSDMAQRIATIEWVLE